MKIVTITLSFILVAFLQEGNADMFAGFDSFCGLPVVVGYDPQTASARKDQTGAAFIHVDPGAMANWTMSRMFTLAHECAHHVLGHTSDLGAAARYYGGTANQELAADCWAAQQLRSVGYDSEISRTILQNASQGHFSTGGYPSGQQRAQNILNCLGVANCRSVTRACQHPAHPAGDSVPCTHAVPAHPAGDVYPCQHPCPGPFGFVPCHPQGDIGQCQHAVAAHQFDLVPCTHPAHPLGDIEQVCN